MVSRIRIQNFVALTSLSLMLAGSLAGCCKPGVRPQIAGSPHAIFNPPSSQTALAVNTRVDGPAAYIGDGYTEEIAYHEQFVDIQGRGYEADNGYLYRRFQSDRFGRGRR